MEPIRREALVKATLAEIGSHGTLDVTVSQIARRAGMSSALAHHYFGSKERLISDSVRALLSDLRGDAISALKAAKSDRARVSALIAVSFSDKQFSAEVVAAWLAFYVDAQRAPEIRRLLSVYARRLHSNLMSGLAPLAGAYEAERIAEGAAAMIDGLYIRKALGTGPARHDAVALVEDHIETHLLEIRGRTL
jgi:TetR/AcrR family transcriptional repressor of bet genes